MAKEEAPKKLIIDEDWKTQAQKEKEVLKKQEEQEHKQQPEEERHAGFPAADLSALISMLATQAYLALGVLGAEEEEQHEPDLAAAQFHIDLLAMIEEKTRGNATKEETKLLAGASTSCGWYSWKCPGGRVNWLIYWIRSSPTNARRCRGRRRLCRLKSFADSFGALANAGISSRR